MRQKIVIDTDIGTDVDDAFALIYAIKNPNADLRAISTVTENTNIRAKIARKLERMLKVDIPIIAGQRGPDDSVKKYWTGIEQKALTHEELKEPFKNSEYPIYTSDTKLICIGPLTNIELQLQINPSIKNARNIYVMGSSECSHNFKTDLKSWHEVQQQPWNIYQITKKDSEKILFTKKELEELRENSLGDFLCESAIRWLDYVNNGIDHFPKTSCAMYDVLTVSAAIGEDYVKFEQISPNKFLSCGVDLKLKDKIIEVIRN
jgi:purine nucleosidase